MKYIWIIMLAVVDIVWIIASVVEFIRVINVLLKYSSIFDWMYDFLFEFGDYATWCLLIHLFVLFSFSLVSFFE